MPLNVLIIDGYSPESRAQFREVGMKWAGELYRAMLLKQVPDAQTTIWYSSDPGCEDPPDDASFAQFDALLWPGCNLTVYHDDPRVRRHLALCERAFAGGKPQFGSCWAIQVAAQIAGGEVGLCPKGREMGIGTKIQLTEAGRNHPMFAGKPPVFSHFMSHDDEVTRLPETATLLAGNDWSAIQAAEIRHLDGSFWAVQYHPEYDLHELARLIVARLEKLIKLGYFQDEADALAYVEKCETLFQDPTRKDLRWQLRIDDDLLDDGRRHCEFVNWLRHEVLQEGLPNAQ